MNRTLRYVLIGVGVLIVLLIVAPFLIPVNQFRGTIEQKASAALGRRVQVGNLSLSLLHGGLAAENLSIGDDPKFSPSPFLTAKSVDVGVEVMPLIFSRELNVTSVVIQDPQVTLLKNAAGDWNYSTLGASPAKTAKAEAPPNPSGSTPDVSVKKLELSNGKIIVGTTSSQQRTTYDKVNVTASDASLDSKFPIKVSADLPGGGSLKLEGTAGPVDKIDSALTPVDAKLHVESLNLATTGILDPSLGLGGIVDVDTTLANQGGFAPTNGTVKLAKALFVQGGGPAGVPMNVAYSTKYDLRKNSGVLNPSTVKIGR